MLQRLKYFFKFLGSLLSTNFRLIYGMWRLTKLPQPAITVFGGSRIGPESELANQAVRLSKLLVEQGFSIITGGGPGIMAAANQGAMEYLKECRIDGQKECKPLVSVGIGLLRLNLEKSNPYLQENIKMEHFFSRKWLLVRYAVGFVIFPGGFGTLDELFEIMTLIQTNRMPKKPIILINKHYWEPIIEWIHNRALPSGLIDSEDEKLIHILDDVQEAADIISQQCKDRK
jgi:hypothetical protein